MASLPRTDSPAFRRPAARHRPIRVCAARRAAAGGRGAPCVRPAGVVDAETVLRMLERLREPALMEHRARHQRLRVHERRLVIAARRQALVQHRFRGRVLAPQLVHHGDAVEQRSQLRSWHTPARARAPGRSCARLRATRTPRALRRIAVDLGEAAPDVLADCERWARAGPVPRCRQRQLRDGGEACAGRAMIVDGTGAAFFTSLVHTRNRCARWRGCSPSR